MRKFLLLLIISIISFTGYSQDFSNKGKDFWVGYGNHVRMFNTGAAETMEIYLTSDVNTTGNVSVASIGFSQNFTVTANQLTVVTIPRTAALLNEGLYNHGIHITALKPIVAYGFIYVNAISGATVFLPTNTLGKEYYALNYTQVANEANCYSYFFVEAVEPGTTTIQITPSQTTKGGWPANVMQTVNLTQGQIYQVLSATDLTGSIVKSVASGGSGCKKIAVFCGSGKISIGCASPGSSDNLYQQMYPASTWGKKYVLIPSNNKPTTGNPSGSFFINTNFFRIYRPDPTTVVNLNGAPIPAASFVNNYYQFSSSLTNLVDADKPILVAQYFSTQGCSSNNNPHDPEMVYLNPVEQTVTDVTVNSMQPAANTAITQHFINVVLRNSGTGISSFKIDGVTPNAVVTVLPQDNNYAYLRINYTGNSTSPLASGAHHLTCDSGFNAIAYGFGNAESYGYSAGTNLKDLYQQIAVSTQYGIETSPSVCTGSPFKFKVSLPYCADSIRWNLSNLPGPPVPTNPIVYYTSCTPGVPGGPDSTTTVNGKTLYWYNLPTFYSFGTVGVYPVTITTYTTTVSTCGSEQDIDFDLQVSDPPVANFTFTNNGCVTDSVRFFDNSVTVKPIYHWWWDFGEPSSGVNNNSSVKNPVHKYASAGTYTVRYTNITTPGCLSDTISKQIVVTNVPTAKFGMSGPICEGKPVTFSDTSALVAPGTLVKWYWNFGDGFSVVRTNGSDTTHIYTPWNPAVTDSLIVETNTGCKSLPFIKTFKVHPNPVSDFSLPAGVCLPWDSAHFISTSTIADATGGFGYLWNFGDPPSAPNNTSILPNPAHHYNNVGPFNIKLITTSAAGCVDSVTKVLSNIYLQAVAGFTVNPENCLNDVTTFTDNSTGSGNTIAQWYWDFGDGSPIDNTQNPTHIYATTGVKTIRHWVKTNMSCYSDTAVLTVTINPLPTVNYTYTAPSCETRVISFTDASVANAGSLSTWQWDFGDASPVSNQQSPVHTFAAAGTYSVKLTVITSKGCVNNIIKQVVINARPLAGFITPEVCLSDTYAQFSDTSKVAAPATISAWQWNFGDPNATVPNPNTSTLQNPTHSYTAVGPYNIQLIATSTTGCKDTLNQTLIVNGSFPQANFTVTNAAALCANDSVAIVEASTVFPGSITKVEIYWDNLNFPAGPPQTDNIPFTGKVYKHLYLPNSQVTKTYQIRYRAYSGGVCVNDKLSTITVNAAPKVQFTAMPDICYDAAPYQITQGSEIGAVPGNGVYSGPGVSPTGLFNPVVAGIGVHSIKYTFTSSAAGCVDSIRQNIRVLDTASARFIFVGPVCEGTPATFKEISTAPSGVVLANSTWNFGDGSPLETHAPGSTFTHAFPGWATYTVTMYNTSAYGCKSAATAQQVYISPIPKADFTFNETSVCLPNASVSFKNTSAIADGSEVQFIYAWDLGDLTTSVAKTPPPHIYTGTGPYTVQLKVTSGNNCVNTVSHPIDFIHPQPKAAFDFSKPEVCIGDIVVFRDLTNGLDGSVVKWNWNFGDGSSGNLALEPHLYSSVKTYNVSLFIINSKGCNSDTLTQQFTVHPYPVVDAGPDRWVLQGGAITIQPVVTGNDLQYLWSPATYLNSTIVESPVASNMQDDITYRLTVTARGGCKKSDDMFVKVLKAPKVPNTFTPNGDGINETWMIQYLDTYPDNKVQVFTRTGQLVFESKGYKTPWDGKLNGKPLPFDTYYYIIEPGNGRAPVTGYVTIVK
ncbi:PKD domain-containing protein [Ferruginibacter sp. SUN106]|uniref:PKD domain-containing protein n=1 Tax=Ferruginibacter sp. SUN106 TaxID=2978348 RepID=UPI003D35F281